MIKRARQRQTADTGDDAAAPPAPAEAPAWTPEKVRGVLEAQRSFVSNQANKHGVPAREVWDLGRDEVLDPGGR